MHEPWTIRPFSDTDGPAVDALLVDIWGDDHGALAFYAPEPAARGVASFHQTLVAVPDPRPETVSAVGNIGIYAEHPAHLMLNLNVHPSQQGRGLGRQLFRALLAQAEPYEPRPLMAATYEDQLAALEFLRRRGFREAMQTYIPTLELAGFDPEPYAARLVPLTAAGYRLAALAELPDRAMLATALADLYASHYIATHQHSPPGATIWDDRDDTFMGDDLDAEGEFVVLHSEVPVAALGLRRSEWPSTRQVVFAVDRGEADLDAVLLLALLGRAAAWAKGSGAIARLRVELDSVDPAAMALRAAFPWQQRPAWITLVTPER